MYSIRTVAAGKPSLARRPPAEAAAHATYPVKILVPSGDSRGSNSRPSADVIWRSLDTTIRIGSCRSNRRLKKPTAARAAKPAMFIGLKILQAPLTAATGIVAAGVSPPLDVDSASRCGNISSALCHLSAGFFSKHRITSDSRAGDTLSRCFVTGSTCSVTCAARIICGEVPVNRRPPGQEFIGHRTHGVDVGPVVGIGICRCLLGGHVGRRTECHARGGKLLTAGGFADGFGHTEVHHQRMTARDHDVVGLDVAMDHSLLVRQSVYDLAKNLYRFGYWEFAFFLDSLAQGFTSHEGHDVVEESVGFARVVKR